MYIGRWTNARRVLCVRLDSLGDVLMTTPALSALKNAMPGRSLTLLTSSQGGGLAEFLPHIDDLILYDPPWMKATPAERSPDEDFIMIDRLRREKFDAAVIFTVFSQSPQPAALLCYLADIPLRLAHCRENPYHLLTDWIVEEEPEKRVRHEVQRQLDLVAAVGCQAGEQGLQLAVPRRIRDKMRRLLRRCGLKEQRPWLVLHAGGSAPSRRYPLELFTQVADALSDDHGFQLVFTGMEEERDLVEAVRAPLRHPSLSLLGRLDGGELAGLLSIAPLLLSNNTAPVHIASAFGTPVVDLYALTNPQHTPWQTPNRVLSYDVPCKNCFHSVCPLEQHPCLRGVSPQTVIHAVLDLWRETEELRSTKRESQPVGDAILLAGSIPS